MLNGQLIREGSQIDTVFLADIVVDMAELRGAAERRRRRVRERRERDYAARMAGEKSYAVSDASAMRVHDRPNNSALGDT